MGSMEEVGAALEEQGFGLSDLMPQRGVDGEVDMRRTIAHAFSPVEGGDGIVSGVLVKKDLRYIACIREDAKVQWTDVLATGSKGILSDAEFAEFLEHHECFRIFRSP